MAILMLVMMPHMYPKKALNAWIIFSAVVLFAGVLLCLRTQVLVTDAQYMKAMIPHHSSAIMTSRHATISNPEVRSLADSIIASQRREIEEMKRLLHEVR